MTFTNDKALLKKINQKVLLKKINQFEYKKDLQACAVPAGLNFSRAIRMSRFCRHGLSLMMLGSVTS